MRLLLCLAERAGEVVSIDEILRQVWPDVTVTADSVYQAVTSLRRMLGDDAKEPTYIATVPRLGYRMVATVGPLDNPSISSKAAPPCQPPAAAIAEPGNSGLSRGASLKWIAALCLILLVASLVVFFVRGRHVPSNPSATLVAAAQPQRSIAVLPFLDLTKGMKEEEFADGMTEELIDKLTKMPGLRVPPPTSSFYFKGKQIPVADIAKTLGVAYVLDGSVRKSGGRVRIAARLIRADRGYVAWSETYDRPFGDVLMIQDDIAGEVAKALKASIESPHPPDQSH